MAEKTPRELLRETLERSAREVASWPAWMRSAVSTEGVFAVAGPSRERVAREDSGHRGERGADSRSAGE